jgi:hypothetical protein
MHNKRQLTDNNGTNTKQQTGEDRFFVSIQSHQPQVLYSSSGFHIYIYKNMLSILRLHSVLAHISLFYWAISVRLPWKTTLLFTFQ